MLILRGRFPLLAPVVVDKQTNVDKVKNQAMGHQVTITDKEPNKMEINPLINANGGKPSEADTLEKRDFGHLQDGSRSPPTLSSGINFRIGKEQPKNEISENLVEPKERQCSGTKSEVLKDWELLEIPNPFCCAHCDHQTFNSTNMRRHLSACHSIFQCEMCPYETKRTGHLEVHLESAHKEIFTWFKCDQCTFAVTQKKKLESHVAVEHIRKEVSVKEPTDWEGVEKIKMDLASLGFVNAKRS